LAPVGQTGFLVLVQSRDWVLLSVLTVGAAAAALGLLLFVRRVTIRRARL
jgi:hypothetical protein